MFRRRILRVFFLGFTIMFASLFFVNFGNSQSQGGMVAVEVGDYARYGNISITWNSTDPNSKPDQELVELNNTVWFQNEVVDVSTTEISFNQNVQFKNGSSNTKLFEIDVYDGIGNASLEFIPAGLNAGEEIFPSGSTSILINKTVLRTYACETCPHDVVREANQLSLTHTGVDENLSQTIYFSINYYWDRETGVLTERSGELRNQTGSYLTSWTRYDSIVETNLWGVEDEVSDNESDNESDNSGSWYVAIGIIVAVVAFMFAWKLWPRKRKLKTKRSRVHRYQYE